MKNNGRCPHGTSSIRKGLFVPLMRTPITPSLARARLLKEYAGSVTIFLSSGNPLSD